MLGTRELSSLMIETYEEWYRHKAPRLSAALAFYTTVSLAPLLVVMLSIGGFFFGAKATQGQLAWQIEGLIGHQSAMIIEGVIENAAKPVTASTAAILSFCLTLF